MMIYPFILSIALTASPQSLLESAQSFITQENWQEAATALDEYARTVDHPTAEAMYDRGVAHYNLGEYDVAQIAFDNAMASTTDPTLKTFSAFNLGNAMYRQTMESLEGKGTGAPSDEDLAAIENAKSQIQEVLQNYRTAINNDPADMDARANGELAWQMLQQLDQMQEQMEEQQEQEQDDQQQEQNEENADQQQEQNQKQQDDNSSQEQQDDNSSQEQQEQDSEQSEENQKQEQQGEQSEENQEQQEQDDEQSEQNKEQNQSPQDGEQQDSNQSDEQSDKEELNQQTQEGDLESTDEEMEQSKAQQATERDEGERLSEEEANRLLQLIRDKEQKRRKELAARRANRRVPVEKDW
jgi:Ca-activated chloride channel family protein